jgi:hypothetical protein
MFDGTDLSLVYGNDQQQPIQQPTQQQQPLQQAQVPPEVEYSPPDEIYLHEQPNKKIIYREPGFFDKLGNVKMEVLKLFVFALIILLAISMDRTVSYYLKLYLDENMFSWNQEFMMRFSYPIFILIIIWIIKALW